MKSVLTHHLPFEFQLTALMETDVGNYFFYGHVLVVEAKEGIMLSYKKDFSILLKTLSIIGDMPWSYISNRINSYSIQPIDYKFLNTIPNLKSFGVVNYNDAGRLNANLEAKFCTKPFQVFTNLTNAVIWGKSYL